MGHRINPTIHRLGGPIDWSYQLRDPLLLNLFLYRLIRSIVVYYSAPYTTSKLKRISQTTHKKGHHRSQKPKMRRSNKVTKKTKIKHKNQTLASKHRIINNPYCLSDFTFSHCNISKPSALFIQIFLFDSDAEIQRIKKGAPAKKIYFLTGKNFKRNKRRPFFMYRFIKKYHFITTLYKNRKKAPSPWFFYRLLNAINSRIPLRRSRLIPSKSPAQKFYTLRRGLEDELDPTKKKLTHKEKKEKKANQRPKRKQPRQKRSLTGKRLFKYYPLLFSTFNGYSRTFPQKARNFSHPKYRKRNIRKARKFLVIDKIHDRKKTIRSYSRIYLAEDSKPNRWYSKTVSGYHLRLLQKYASSPRKASKLGIFLARRKKRKMHRTTLRLTQRTLFNPASQAISKLKEKIKKRRGRPTVFKNQKAELSFYKTKTRLFKIRKKLITHSLVSTKRMLFSSNTILLRRIYKHLKKTKQKRKNKRQQMLEIMQTIRENKPLYKQKLPDFKLWKRNKKRRSRNVTNRRRTYYFLKKKSLKRFFRKVKRIRRINRNTLLMRYKKRKKKPLKPRNPVQKRAPIWLMNSTHFLKIKPFHSKIIKNLRTLNFLLRFLKFQHSLNLKKRLFFQKILISSLASLLAIIPKGRITNRIFMLLHFSHISLLSYQYKHLNFNKNLFKTRFLYFNLLSKIIFFSLHKTAYLSPHELTTIRFYGLNNKNMNANLLVNIILLKLEQYLDIQQILTPIIHRMRSLRYCRGYRFIISGRLTRKERASFIVKNSRRMPLSAHTAKIDSCQDFKIMKFGVVGIKIHLLLSNTPPYYYFFEFKNKLISP